MRRLLLVYSFIFSLISVQAQQFEPCPVNTYNQTLAEICIQGEKPRDIIKNLSGKEKKKAKELFEGRSEFLRSLMKRGYFIYESPILDYVNTIYQKLAMANSEIDANGLILLSRSNSINAFSAGNGILVVNLGLINQVKSVDELAFVIGHELSHDVRAHGDEKILAQARVIADKERSKEIKKIIRSEYRVYSQLKDYYLPGMLAQMQYSREKELEADGLGLQYAQNAGFTLSGAIDCLYMLDKSDESVYNEKFNWHGYAVQHPCEINPYWESNSQESSLGNFQIEEEDYVERLKSHPDCVNRVSALRSHFSVVDSSAVQDLRAQFPEIKKSVKYELVASGMALNNYGYALYHGVQQLRLDPTDSYMMGLVTYLYADLAYLKLLWQAGKVLSPADVKNHPADYYDFLSVIWELSPNETSCLASRVWNSCKSDLPEDWNIAISSLLNYVDGEKEEADVAAKNYLNNYKGEKFTEKMQLLLQRK